MMLKVFIMKLLIKNYKVIIFLIILFFLAFSSIILVNREEVRPKKHEILAMIKFYSKLLSVKNNNDLINLQNYTVRNISHSDNGIGEIKIQDVLKLKKGLCFHRSLLLQKALLFNGIKIRPVFIYSNEKNDQTSMFDFFSKEVYSHNIFEFKWKGKWYVMRTNTMMNAFESLDEYLKNQKLFKNKPRFVRYLNNRNGRFIAPSFLPDIYFF